MIETTQAVNPAAQIGGESATQRIAAFLANSEAAQVDNSVPGTLGLAPSAEKTAEVVETPKAKEPEAAPKEELKPEETKEAKTGEPSEESDEAPDEADFKSVSGKDYLTDADAVKAKFPRNSSNELVAEFVEVSKEAKEGNELKAKLGGEHFIEPLADISKALQTGEFEGLFKGILNASSEEALMYVLGEAVDLAFVKGPQWKQQAGGADFGNAMEALVDISLQSRFGATVTAERLEKLAEIDAAIGLVERVEKWRDMEEVPYEELDEMMTSLNDPKYAALVRDKAELKRQLETKATQEKKVASVESGKHEANFSADIETQIGSVLNDVVWNTSVLKDISSDTPEMKADKAFYRSILEEKAVQAFQKSTQKAALLDGYKNGRQNTSTYKKQLTDAVNAAILATKEPTSRLESKLAKEYGLKRNAKLATSKTEQPVEKLPPTVQTPVPQAAPTRQKTIDTFREYFSNTAR